MTEHEERDMRDRLIRMEERLLIATRETAEIRVELKDLKLQMQSVLNIMEQAKGVKWMLSDTRIISFIWMAGAAILGFVAAKLGIKP